MLSGQHIPALALNGVNDLFMATGDDFAIAISPYYVRTMLQPALEPIEAFKAGQKVTSLGVTWTAYSADVTNAIIDFESGALVLVVFGKVKVWGALISDDEFDFTVKQKFVLKLDSASQLISLQTSGGISIAGLPQKIKNLAKPKIEAARDNAVAAAQPTIQEALKDRRTTLNDALKRFDTSANAKFTAVEIDPEGIILRGAITLSVRPPAVVDVEEFAGGAALTAFKSWIPGGSVARFNWSWIKSTGDVRLFPWEGAETTVVTDPHRFTIGVGGPGQPQAGQRICLEIEGPQDGSPGEVSGGETCHVEAPWWMGAVAGVSSALAKILLVPVWGPDPGPDGMLEHAIVAHMNLHSDIHVDELDMPGIVHFATSGMAGPLPLLNEAVFLSRHRGRPIPVIVVLPRGSFAKPRRLLENQLGTSIRSFSGPLIITEDYEGGWAKAFGAAQQSATYLVRPSGEPIWRSEGLDRDGLTSVLDGHQFRSQSPGVRPSTFGVRSGEPAAEAFYTNDSSPVFRTLRGQRVEIAFWKSWSAPSVNELLRLQSAYQRSEARDGVLVAIGDGESPETVMEFGRKHGIGVTLVPDPERRISSLFRIHCWPSTISVDETGRIVRAHVGTSRR
ncbi:MAG: peroxiredoxin family protein [Rhizobiaceae bacterium]